MPSFFRSYDGNEVARMPGPLAVIQALLRLVGAHFVGQMRVCGVCNQRRLAVSRRAPHAATLRFDGEGCISAPSQRGFETSSEPSRRVCGIAVRRTGIGMVRPHRSAPNAHRARRPSEVKTAPCVDV